MTSLRHWHEFATPETLAETLAGRIADVLAEGIRARGRALLAVSGGTTPVHLFKALSEAEIAASESWKPILPRQKLQMDHIHEYGADVLADIGPVTHVRYAMHPDGGTMRLRLFGVKA